jgi:hypothetical protein
MMALSLTAEAAALVEQAEACALAYDVAGAIRAYKAAIAADLENLAPLSRPWRRAAASQSHRGCRAGIPESGRAMAWLDRAAVGWRRRADSAVLLQYSRDDPGARCLRGRCGICGCEQQTTSRAASKPSPHSRRFKFPYQSYNDRGVQTHCMMVPMLPPITPRDRLRNDCKAPTCQSIRYPRNVHTPIHAFWGKYQMLEARESIDQQYGSRGECVRFTLYYRAEIGRGDS